MYADLQLLSACCPTSFGRGSPCNRLLGRLPLTPQLLMLRVGHFYSLLQPRVAFSLLRRFGRELSRRDVGCRAPSASTPAGCFISISARLLPLATLSSCVAHAVPLMMGLPLRSTLDVPCPPYPPRPPIAYLPPRSPLSFPTACRCMLSLPLVPALAVVVSDSLSMYVISAYALSRPKVDVRCTWRCLALVCGVYSDVADGPMS